MTSVCFSGVMWRGGQDQGVTILVMRPITTTETEAGEEEEDTTTLTWRVSSHTLVPSTTRNNPIQVSQSQ